MDTEQQKKALLILMAVSDTVREMGEVPSGHIYAALTGKVDFQGFQGVIRTLKGAGLIKQNGDLLVWTGPTLEGAKNVR